MFVGLKDAWAVFAFRPDNPVPSSLQDGDGFVDLTLLNEDVQVAALPKCQFLMKLLS
ncbi:MAG TPA: hypothetical protein VGE93_02515 [Bryobacteraceae bacterium]